MITLAGTDTLYGLAGAASTVTYSIFGMQLSVGSPSWSKLAQGQLGTSAAVIYTSPSGTPSFLSAIVLYNTGSSATNVQMFAGGSAASNQLFNVNIQAYGQVFIDQGGMQCNDGNGNALITEPTFMSSNIPLATVQNMASSIGSDTGAARRDHTHASLGGVASNNAIQLISFGPYGACVGAIPPNTLQAGSVWRLHVFCQLYSAGSAGSAQAWVLVGPCGPAYSEYGNPTYNGSPLNPGDAYTQSGYGIPATGGLYPFDVHYVVTFYSATGGHLQPVLSFHQRDGLGTIVTTPVFSGTVTTGYLAGKVDPTITNYLYLMGMQYYNAGYGFGAQQAVFEQIK
jgi:hypothetical protein